jgi:hypothetical protein
MKPLSTAGETPSLSRTAPAHGLSESKEVWATEARIAYLSGCVLDSRGCEEGKKLAGSRLTSFPREHPAPRCEHES